MKRISFGHKIKYWVLLLALFSAIKAMDLYGQGGFLDPKKLEILAEQGGYISSIEPPSYRIESAKGKREILEEGDIAFLNAGKKQMDIKPGDQLLVFRVEKLVIHPVTHENLGNLIKIVGKLRIEEATDKTSIAMITEIYDNPILKGDRVMPLRKGDAASKEATVERKEGEALAGYIVAIKDARQNATQGDIIYIDRGKADAISVGDAFIIHHSSDLTSAKRSQIGLLRIISVQERTSTAIISHSSTEIAVGDVIVE
jgi:hypothetical protein